MHINHDIPWTSSEFWTKLMDIGFKPEGAYTMRLVTPRDIITVFDVTGVVIILHDGSNVVPNWQMKQIRSDGNTFFWEGVFQDIVGLL